MSAYNNIKYNLSPQLAPVLTTSLIVLAIDLLGKRDMKESLYDLGSIAVASFGTNYATQILYDAVDNSMPQWKGKMDGFRNLFLTPALTAYFYNLILNSTMVKNELNISEFRTDFKKYLYGYLAAVGGKLIGGGLFSWII